MVKQHPFYWLPWQWMALLCFIMSFWNLYWLNIISSDVFIFSVSFSISLFFVLFLGEDFLNLVFQSYFCFLRSLSLYWPFHVYSTLSSCHGYKMLSLQVLAYSSFEVSIGSLHCLFSSASSWYLAILSHPSVPRSKPLESGSGTLCLGWCATWGRASMQGDGWVASSLSTEGTPVLSFLMDYSVSHGGEGWEVIWLGKEG